MMRRYKHLCSHDSYVYEHRFVMEQFLGHILTSDQCVHHKDGDGQNNNLTNLEVMSQKQHRQLEGRRARISAKLSIEDVLDIRKMLKDGIFQWLIAKIFEVNRHTICRINCGNTWSWV